MTIESSKKIIEKFHPNLIITVDCGISCFEEVEYIKQQNIDIIITDHHEIPEFLPKTIVVDPKLPNQKYDFNGLCGAGVALKVVQSFVGKDNLDQYLPICAIATVSDIVPLIDENRAIVKLGLSRQEHLPHGIKMLLNNLKITNITSQAISFKIAPKLNATGRMGNAYYSLDLYIKNDTKAIKKSLEKVDELNTLRQKLSQEIFDECLKLIQKDKLYKNKAIILKSSKWDSGLLGIACARLVDEFYRPVFLFSDVDGDLKGSVRSIDGINIHHVLSNCNEYLETFGGHSMAAGLSLKLEHFDEFKEEINEYLTKNTTKKSFLPVKTYDVAVRPEELNLELAKELELLEPFGCENPNPQFMISYQDCKVSHMPHFENHINININGTKFVSFNAGEYIDDYNFAENKQTIVELQTNEYAGKQYLTGIVKKTLFYGYGKNLQDIANGRILKQQIANKKYYKYIDFFDFNQTKELFDKLFDDDNGTCVVIYNKNTFEKFKQLLSTYKLNYYVGGSQSKFEENCVVFALNDVKNVASYKNLVFLDSLISNDFLSDFDGDVFALKNTRFHIENLNMSYEFFGQVYKAIKQAINSKEKFYNELELFETTKKFCRHIPKL
ncbi:MAG: hypothetical protein J6T39_01450, partial [Clostridia bacterium]|nr:hypothetical protein [Clostridia bacterium]